MGAAGPRRVLASTAGVTTVCVLPSFLVGAMAVQIRPDLGFDESGVGIVFAAFFAAASLASAPLGRITERSGPVRSLRVAAVVSGGACLVAAGIAQSLVTLVAPIVVAGASNALCQPAANLLIARALPPERQGFAFAVKQSAIPAATLLAGASVPLLARTVGWRWGFVGAGVVSFAAAAWIPPLASPAKAARGQERGTSTDVPLSVMTVLALGIGFGAAAGGTLGSFLVSAAVDGGLAEGSAGWLLTAGSLVGIATRLLLGVRADRRDGGHLRVVALLLVLGTGTFIVLSVHEVWAYLAVGPLGFCTAWAWPGLFNLAVVRANPTRPAAATGITQTGTYLGAVSGPLLFGVLAEQTSFQTAWLAAAGFALTGAIAITEGRRRLRAWRANEIPPVDPVPA